MNYLSQLSLSFFSHQFILIICIFITFFITIIFIYLFFYNHNNTIFNSNFLLEYFWTFIPVVLVIILFIPLFFFNNFLSSEFDFNYFIIGNQWFWDFIYLDNFVFSTSLFNYDFLYNSYPTVYLPALYKLNFYLTSNDVLHAFSLPHLYTMIDLVPGSLHTLNLFFPYSGVYTVYCAQICGINHWAMPFIVCAVSNFFLG